MVWEARNMITGVAVANFQYNHKISSAVTAELSLMIFTKKTAGDYNKLKTQKLICSTKK